MKTETKKRKTTWADAANLGACEQKEFRVSDGISEMGRSTVIIECPFCGSTVEAFIWSFSSCGKRCSCGALLQPSGIASQLKTNLGPV